MKLIRHSMPDVGGTDLRELSRVLRTRHVGYGGGTVARFEENLRDLFGVRHALAVNSGSAALHLALLALDVRRGDRVLMPTYTCAAVMNAVCATGAAPLLIDVDPSTFNMSADAARRAMSGRVRAVILPHMFGLPADVAAFRKLGPPLIEDCSMSVGATIAGRMTGSFGVAAIASFYATKVLTTGGGGALFARDAAVHRRAADLVNYDNRDDYRLRYNYGMSALNAALGIAQLRKLPAFLKRRREIAEMYYGSLNRLPLSPPAGGERGHLFYRYVIRIRGSVDRTIRRMAARGVECKRPVWRPLHQYFPNMRGRFPAADDVHRHCLSIPIHPALSDSDVRRVIDALRKSVD